MNFINCSRVAFAVFLGSLMMIPISCKKKDNPSSPASAPVADTATFTPITTATPTNTGVNTSTPTATSTATLSPTPTNTRTSTFTPTATNTQNPNASILHIGDVVITQFESSAAQGADYFYFVPLHNLGAGTTIYVTDEGWDGSLNSPTFSSAYSDKDGIYLWTTTEPVTAGTVIEFVGGPGNGCSSSVGTVTNIFGNTPMKLGAAEDQIFLFQAASVDPSTGVVTSPVLITGLGMSGWITGGNPSSKNSWLPAQLDPNQNGGVTAALGGIFNGADGTYNCINTDGTPADLRNAIYTVSNWNWNDGGGGGHLQQPIPSCVYTVE
jgi:hypothetical protein